MNTLFKAATPVSVDILMKGLPYRILYAQKCLTPEGVRLILKLGAHPKNVFVKMPNYCAGVLTDSKISRINKEKLFVNLSYWGRQDSGDPITQLRNANCRCRHIRRCWQRGLQGINLITCMSHFCTINIGVCTTYYLCFLSRFSIGTRPHPPPTRASTNTRPLYSISFSPCAALNVDIIVRTRQSEAGRPAITTDSSTPHSRHLYFINLHGSMTSTARILLKHIHYPPIRCPYTYLYLAQDGRNFSRHLNYTNLYGGITPASHIRLKRIHYQSTPSPEIHQSSGQHGRNLWRMEGHGGTLTKYLHKSRNLKSDQTCPFTTEGFGDFKRGGQIIHTVKYANDPVLLAKEEKVLQDINKLIEIGRCFGMEMNVKKNKSNENFKTTIPSKNYHRPKTTGECGIF